MALVVTIATVNRTSIVETDSIRISQVADSFTFTAELSLFDADGDITITAGSHLVADEITIVDGATTYFGGYVVNQDILAAEDGSRHLNLQCQGYGIRLNETIVASEAYTIDSDKEIIDDLFDTYLAAFDSDTEVAAIVDPLAITFTEMTLAEIMGAICERTQGRWYVDNSKKVHYFAAESDAVAWFLSDTPEAAMENLVVNPSLETNLDGWGNYSGGVPTQSDTQAKFGTYSIRVVTPGTDNDEGCSWTGDPIAAITLYTASAWVYAPADSLMRIHVRDAGGGAANQTFVGTGDWQRVEVSLTTAAVPTLAQIIIGTRDDVQAITFYVDGVQLELGATATSYCDGTRAGCTWSGAAHASTSDRIISYSYHAKPTKQIDAAAIVNRIRVVGADDFAVTRNDATSQAAYGIRAGIITDQTLETTAAMEERGDDVLDKNKDPRTTYTVRTYQDGAVAGQDIGFRCPQLDIDTTQVIRELMIIWRMNVPVYELTLGTHAETVAISRAFYTGGAIRDVVISPTVPIASLGWSCDMVFSATDYNTVAWAGGTITLAGGTGTFSIDAGNTGNMAATTYIYLDIDVSATVLQTTTSAANAIGGHKILVAVAAAVADDASGTHAPTAEFAVFGGHGSGVLITDSQIAADTITADLIGSNNVITVTANITDAVITNAKITDVFADRIKANKIRIGEMFFTDVDGLLLLNPPIRIEKPAATSYWHATRKHKATLSGAIHLEQGRWRGTKAMVVEIATTNYTDDPVLGKGDLTEWTLDANLTETRDTGHVRFGTHSMKLVPTGGDTDNWIYDTTNWTDDAELENETVTLSVYVWIPSGVSNTDVVLKVYEDVGGGMGLLDSKVAAAIYDRWQRVSLTVAFSGLTDVRWQLNFDSDNVGHEIWADGFQLEKLIVPTTLCHGDLGDGYAWDGAAHASTSTRAVTEVNLDDHVGLISGNDTLSFRIVAQMPYDAAATWPQVGSHVFTVRGADDDNRVTLLYDYVDNRFELYINGGFRINAGAASFSAGDWLDIILTLDFANDSYVLYIDGVSEGDDDTALDAPTLTKWALGYYTEGGFQGGFVFAEHAVFDRMLTAIEVAQLYNLQRPLIDTGAMDKPGIYIIDGQFRIQSSQTGNRIVITAEEIAGYDAADTKQFYITAADGKGYFGGGDVMLDEDGITLVDGTAALNKVKWHSGALDGTLIGSVYADWAGGGGDAAITWVISEKIAGSDYGAVILRAADTAGAGDDVRIVINTDNEMVVDEVDTVAWNDNALNTYIFFDESTGIEIRDTRDLRCGGGIVAGSATVNPPTGTLVITDGIAAPAQIAGFATIYVDNADGDLKVRFADGFVAVIAADS